MSDESQLASPPARQGRRFIYHYTCISSTAATFPSPLRGGVIELAFPVIDAKAYSAVRQMVATSPDGGELIALSFLHVVE